MKTKLLYLASFLLVLFTSCSVDEISNESSADEKEEAVKNLFNTFSKSVVPSLSYSKFMEEAKMKSSSELTEEEIQQLEEEFLSLQSSEFVQLYYFVKSLNLTEEELRTIVFDYLLEYNKEGLGKIQNTDKNDGDECTVSDSIGSLLFTILAEIVCEISNRSSD